MAAEGNPRDILYAWMIPFYAMLRRTDAGFPSRSRDVQWTVIAAKINEQTRNLHAVHLDEVSNAGLAAEAAEALDRMWSSGFKP